jgi:hypothetical protein
MLASLISMHLVLVGRVHSDFALFAVMEFLIRATSCGGTADTLSQTQTDVQHALHIISIGALLVGLQPRRQPDSNALDGPYN